jgi:hypothetical protein
MHDVQVLTQKYAAMCHVTHDSCSMMYEGAYPKLNLCCADNVVQSIIHFTPSIEMLLNDFECSKTEIAIPNCGTSGVEQS